jgi:hypothetical protein
VIEVQVDLQPLTPDPIFIVGAPRSGTTVVRLLLNAHSRIAIAPETNFYQLIWERFTRTDDTRSWRDAVNTSINVCERRFRPSVDLSRARAALLTHQPGDWSALFSVPIKAWAEAQGKRRWGEKTPQHLFYSDVFMRHFPNARVIEVLRDPRGCVSSMQRSLYFTDSIALNALNWREFASAGHRQLRTSVPPNQLLSVRYEQLLSSPVQVLEEAFAFLEEPFEPSVLDFWKTASEYAAKPGDPLLTQPLIRDADRWRQELTYTNIATIELLCRRQMRRLGWRPDTPLVPNARAIRAAIPAAYWILKRYQHWSSRSHTVAYRPFAQRS